MTIRSTTNSTVEYILDTHVNDDITLIISNMSMVDFEDNELSTTNFGKLFTGLSYNTPVALNDVNNQLKLLKMIVSQGLILNVKPSGDSGNFSYGHMLMRSGAPELITFALKNGFMFNYYTSKPLWHSLELLQLNYLGQKVDKVGLLKIIADQLKKGVDLSKTDTEDFLAKLDRHFKSVGWKELIDLYKNDPYMSKYFDAHLDLIIKKEFFNLISKEAVDIFIF